MQYTDQSPLNRSGKGLVGKALQRVSRYSEILGVLLRFGFTDLVRKLDRGVYRRLRGGKRASRHARRQWSRAESMRRALEELGPTFVKIGQLLSHRPDILPPDWIREFTLLRNQVPPVDFNEVRTILVNELGAPPEEIFTKFDTNPVASASIAQVYRAELPGAALTDDDGIDGPLTPGVAMAVKVQRPGIQRVMEADLAILRDIARMVERRVSSLAVFRPVQAVEEIERVLISELDFRNERENLETFRKNFSDDETVTAPEPLRKYSTRRVLTMTLLDGVPVGDINAMNAANLNRAQLARHGAEAVLRQIFDHRFFHADPHGHNILILPHNVIAFLDLGQMGRLLPSQQMFLADLLTALTQQDAVRAVRAILGWSGNWELETVSKLTNDVEMVMERYLSRPLSNLDIGDMIAALIKLIRQYEISIPSNFHLLAKAISTVEDIAASLDPDFDFIRAAQPFVRRMMRRELSPERMAGQAYGFAGDSLRLARRMPGDLDDLLNLLKSGRFQMRFELKELTRLDATIKKVVTRLSAAVLLAAMIMGSSILVQSLIPPLFYGVPVIGILGFIFSGFVGIYLLVDLWRNR